MTVVRSSYLGRTSKSSVSEKHLVLPFFFPVLLANYYQIRGNAILYIASFPSHLYLYSETSVTVALSMNISRAMVVEFLEEPRILDTVKFDDLLSVRLKVRPCSFFVIPSDLISGDEMGIQVDDECYADYSAISMEIYPRNKLPLIKRYKRTRRNAFKTIVERSAIFKAHIAWAKRFGLKSKAVEVLPATQEIYVFSGFKVGWRLDGLMNERRRLKAERLRTRNATAPIDTADIFTEEFSRQYLLRMGDLLGYPACCVERYAEDRVTGLNVEQRAAGQILVVHGEGGIPSSFAYFVKDFFPCRPDCPEAVAIGTRFNDALTTLHEPLGAAYRRRVQSNLYTVEHYPELIRAHQEKLQSRLAAYRSRLRF